MLQNKNFVLIWFHPFKINFFFNLYPLSGPFSDANPQITQTLLLLHKVPAANWWKESKDVLHSRCNTERSSFFPKTNKVLLHACLSWKERGGGSVVFQAVQACWQKIRCPPDSGACHPARQASYPEPSRSGGLVLSHKSQCQSQGSRHAATCLLPICATVCEGFLSHTLYLCLSRPTQPVHWCIFASPLCFVCRTVVCESTDPGLECRFYFNPDCGAEGSSHLLLITYSLH